MFYSTVRPTPIETRKQKTRIGSVVVQDALSDGHVIVVGDISQGTYEISTSELTVLRALGTAVLSPVAFGAFLWSRGNTEATSERSSGRS